MILSIIFIILSSLMKVIIDTIQFHWQSSVFSKIKKGSKLHNWLNPEFSWVNKWKDNYKPLGEKFWGSSRWFAFITDGWHLFDMLKTLFFICALTFSSFYIPFSLILIKNLIIAKSIDTIILYSIYGLIFNVLFNLLEIKKFK